MAQHRSVFLSPATLDSLTNHVSLIDYIQEMYGPLVRYGRWPAGAKRALCLTGDLDALSLLEYAARFVLA